MNRITGHCVILDLGASTFENTLSVSVSHARTWWADNTALQVTGEAFRDETVVFTRLQRTRGRCERHRWRDDASCDHAQRATSSGPAYSYLEGRSARRSDDRRNDAAAEPTPNAENTADADSGPGAVRYMSGSETCGEQNLNGENGLRMLWLTDKSTIAEDWECLSCQILQSSQTNHKLEPKAVLCAVHRQSEVLATTVRKNQRGLECVFESVACTVTQRGFKDEIAEIIDNVNQAIGGHTRPLQHSLGSHAGTVVDNKISNVMRLTAYASTMVWS